MPTVTIRDESTAGATTHELSLDLLTETLTVRELIRSRVYQEVDDFNRRGQMVFQGLVQPTDTEKSLNGYSMKAGRQIDWKPQFEQACDAFERNAVLILVDDRQVESLDESLTLTPHSRISFLKLLPLVGG